MGFCPARLLAGAVWHLAFFAMVLSAFAPRAGASWQCDGRICGVVAWICCCVQPTTDHDPNCGPSPAEAQKHFNSASHSQEVGACVADCHCTMVVKNAKQPLSRTVFFSPSSISAVAVLPVAIVFQVPHTAGVVQPLESRGPPPNAAFFPSHSLRAPPIA